MLAHPLLPQPATLLETSVCPGVSPAAEPKCCWRASCGLCVLKHGAGFPRKTVKATGSNNSEEQEATIGTGPWWQSQQGRAKEKDSYIICSQIYLNPK